MRANVDVVRASIRDGLELLGYGAPFQDLLNTGFVPKLVDEQTASDICEQERVKMNGS